MERDITMKRHLIEDFKFRQKINSESNENFSQMLESLEKKVTIFISTKNIISHCIYLSHIFSYE